MSVCEYSCDRNTNGLVDFEAECEWREDITSSETALTAAGSYGCEIYGGVQ